MEALFVAMVMLAVLCFGCALCAIVQDQSPLAHDITRFLEALLPAGDDRG